MNTKGLLRSEVHQYLILADELKTRYGAIDDETLRDTLEGLSDLPELIQQVIRSSLDDEAMVNALKLRISDMQERLDRITSRSEKKREIACWAMSTAGIDRLMAEDLSVSLRQGSPKLEILDEAEIPGHFLIPVRPRIDRAGMLACLKLGEAIPGAVLVDGQPHISVRVK